MKLKGKTLNYKAEFVNVFNCEDCGFKMALPDDIDPEFVKCPKCEAMLEDSQFDSFYTDERGVE